MINKNDMSGKLGNIKKMRIVAVVHTLLAFVGLTWILTFYFLYPGWSTGHTAMCWLIFLGFVLPFGWPASLICGFLSIFLPANAVLVLSAASLMIAVLTVLWAVSLPDARNYRYLLAGIQVEKAKSLVFGLFVSVLYFVDAGDQYLLVYTACLLYQLMMAANFGIFCFYDRRLQRMDYREIFGTDWKDPYGQK